MTTDEFQFLKEAYRILADMECIYKDTHRNNAAAAAVESLIRGYLEFRRKEGAE